MKITISMQGIPLSKGIPSTSSFCYKKEKYSG